MKIVLQRVSEAHVKVGQKEVGRAGQGMLIFLGVAKGDAEEDVDYLIRKIIELRIFEDENGKMNRSAKDVKAEFLVVSQFTLLGDCMKGRRPSFDKAAEPKEAERLYELFVEKLSQQDFKVATGEFRAMMDVSLVNDGPVTFVLDSK
ncbi:MAG: D-tyrosyl-tRNA(Tyr) deacylase [Candidatus Omnitrophica bacterium]|nr:D-tyrosyl-tRNA(Tyr) deacylase [Candidatus Omnitrophota bacterium]